MRNNSSSGKMRNQMIQNQPMTQYRKQNFGNYVANDVYYPEPQYMVGLRNQNTQLRNKMNNG